MVGLLRRRFRSRHRMNCRPRGLVEGQQVVGAEVLAPLLAHDLEQPPPHLRVGVGAVLVLDHAHARGVEDHDAQAAALRQLARQLGHALVVGGDGLRHGTGFHRHQLRRGEEPPLAEHHAQVEQRRQLGLRLDPLCDHLGSDLLRKVDQRLQQAALDQVAVDVADQRDVELQVVGLDLHQGLQARVAGAHVVDGDPEALALEVAEDLLVGLALLGGQALGDLQDHVLVAQPVRLHLADETRARHLVVPQGAARRCSGRASRPASGGGSRRRGRGGGRSARGR